MTQYKSHSLIQHIQRGWGYLRGEFGEFVEIVPAQQQMGDFWYRGTADSLYQNLQIIKLHNPKHILVLAGDHIYKMDYGVMLASHVAKRADITVGVVEVPREQATAFGVMSVDPEYRITKFSEKPKEPEGIPGREQFALGSMGIYVFKAALLYRLLEEQAKRPGTSHDFGRNIIPGALNTHKVVAYPFTDNETRVQHYWRDVGTVDAFYDANMEMTHVNPELNIYDEQWPIWTYQRQYPPAKFVLDEEGRRGMAVNSMVSGGCIISGAHGESIAAVLERARGRAQLHRAFGDFPRRGGRRRQRDQASHRRHRRGRAAGHADRRQSRRGCPPVLYERARRGVGYARHAGASAAAGGLAAGKTHPLAPSREREGRSFFYFFVQRVFVGRESRVKSQPLSVWYSSAPLLLGAE